MSKNELRSRTDVLKLKPSGGLTELGDGLLTEAAPVSNSKLHFHV